MPRAPKILKAALCRYNRIILQNPKLNSDELLRLLGLVVLVFVAVVLLLFLLLFLGILYVKYFSFHLPVTLIIMIIILCVISDNIRVDGKAFRHGFAEFSVNSINTPSYAKNLCYRV